MKQKRRLLILILFLNLGSICSCASRTENSSINLNQTDQIILEEEINNLQPTTQELTTENTPPPEKTNQQIYEELLHEYKTIQDEYKLLIQIEGRLIFNKMKNITEEYFNDFGEFPEGIDQLIPQYLSEPPTILGVIDIQYNLSYDKTSYQYFYIAHPIGGRCERVSLFCADGNMVEYFCEAYYDYDFCDSD